MRLTTSSGTSGMSLKLSNSNLNKQASIRVSNSGSLDFYVGQTHAAASTSGTSGLTVYGTGGITHSGLFPTTAASGTIRIDQQFIHNISVALSASSWTDSNISGPTQLVTGVYMLYLQAGVSEFYTGTVPWFSVSGATTLNDEFTEIPLMKTGDGSTVTNVYVRILRVAGGAPKLQLSASATLATYAYTLNFRRIW
jgi:hypothetical protein